MVDVLLSVRAKSILARPSNVKRSGSWAWQMLANTGSTLPTRLKVPDVCHRATEMVPD